jgi:hypothetical protein
MPNKYFYRGTWEFKCSEQVLTEAFTGKWYLGLFESPGSLPQEVSMRYTLLATRRVYHKLKSPINAISSFRGNCPVPTRLDSPNPKIPRVHGGTHAKAPNTNVASTNSPTRFRSHDGLCSIVSPYLSVSKSVTN